VTQQTLRVESAIFTVAIAAMGVLMIVRPDLPSVLVPLPASLSGTSVLVVLSGIWFIASAVAVLAGRRDGPGALSMAGLLTLGSVLHIGPVLMNPGTPAWAIAFETVVLAAAAWTLAGLLTRMPERVGVAARWAFSASLIAFGLFHFLYHAYIENAVPAWIPGHAFWTYGIGGAFIAAGLAVWTGIQARLAATLLTIMFGSWVFIVHTPRVAASWSNANEWSSLLIALACCGASWIVRESLAPRALQLLRVEYMSDRSRQLGGAIGTAPISNHVASRLLLRRMAAYAVDMALLFAVLAPTGWLIERALGFMPRTGPEIWRTLLVNFSVPVWLYFTIADASGRGATFGKRWLRLRVSRQDGTSLSSSRAFGRTAAKLLPWELTHFSAFALAADPKHFSVAQGVGLAAASVIVLGYLACAAFTRGRRSVHDFIARTVVEPV